MELCRHTDGKTAIFPDQSDEFNNSEMISS